MVDEVGHGGRGEQDVQFFLAVMEPAAGVPVVGARCLLPVALPEERVLLLLHLGRVAVYERRGRAHGSVHGCIGRHGGREHGLLRLGPMMHAVDAGAFTVQFGHLVLGDGHVLNAHGQTQNKTFNTCVISVMIIREV